MAEKDEKKAEGKKEETPKDPNEKEQKKSRLVLFAGIAGVLLVALGVGGFFIFKTLGGKKNVELAAEGSPQPESEKKEEKDNKSSKEDPNKKADPKEDPSKKEDPNKKADPNKKDDPNKKEDPNKKADPSKGEDPNKKEEPKGTANFGDTFLVQRMDLNLGNSIENRFIRIAIAIEYRGGENQGIELKKREAQIKDIVITSVTSKTRLILISENGKENLRREILNRVNEVTDSPVQNIYFTEFFVE